MSLVLTHVYDPSNQCSWGRTHQAHRGRLEAASPGHRGAGAGHHLPACLPVPWPPLRVGTQSVLAGGPSSSSARHLAGGPSCSPSSLLPGQLCLLLPSGKTVWQRVGCEVPGVGLGDVAVVLSWKSVLLWLCPKAPMALLLPANNHVRGAPAAPRGRVWGPSPLCGWHSVRKA